MTTDQPARCARDGCGHLRHWHDVCAATSTIMCAGDLGHCDCTEFAEPVSSTPAEPCAVCDDFGCPKCDDSAPRAEPLAQGGIVSPDGPLFAEPESPGCLIPLKPPSKERSAELFARLLEVAPRTAEERERAAYERGKAEATAELERLRAMRLNGPMLASLRRCAADTSPNWDGAITVYPPGAQQLVALVDALRGEPAEQPEQRCPACSRPTASIRDQGGDGLTVARQYLPCGCTRIVPVGGDRG